MGEMKTITSFVVLGDVVGSRRVSDRLELHRRLETTLAEANALFDSDLRITVGDEYQGHCSSLGSAVSLAWWVRLRLLPQIDVRHGIGVGETRVLADAVEDGPGWWAAREAIEQVKAEADRPRTRSRRDRLVVAAQEGSVPSGTALALDAALAGRDELTSRLDDRDLSVVRGLLDGRSQSALAGELGISASAVSQRIRSQGLGVLVEMAAQLGRL